MGRVTFLFAATLRRGAASGLLLLAAGATLVPSAFGDHAGDRGTRGQPITPVPHPTGLDPGKVALGERLFHDPRLASNNAMACATCHQLSQGGDDGLPRSVTNDGQPDFVNAPTVFNAALNFRQTWGGKFRTLEAQAEGALLNPRHANTTWDELLPKLQADTDYVRAFHRLYPEGMTRESTLDAIATFERSLLTPDSRFDQLLRGDQDALTDVEKRGYHLFASYGCVSCHQGVNVGGNLFQKIGVFEDYFAKRGGKITAADLGRFNVTGKERDRHVFRVPSLRNVAVTAPYMHDGRFRSLQKVVKLMGKAQLGVELSAEEIEAIVAFLGTLTGRYQGVTVGATADVRQ